MLRPDCDPRLNRTETKETVGKVLEAMSCLFETSEGLNSRYGLREKRPDSGYQALPPANEIGERKQLAFRQAFNTLRTGPKKTRSDKGSNEAGKGISALSKLVWVAADKDKFGNLIDDISYFIAKFNELLPPTLILLSSMALEDISSSGMTTAAIERVAHLKLPHRAVLEGELVAAAKVTMVTGDIAWSSCFSS